MGGLSKGMPGGPVGSSESDTLTLLRAAAQGDLDARNEAWSRLHTEILRVVRSQRRRWSGNWTLETQALASEVFIKLCGPQPMEPRDRKHFFTTLAKAVRHILLNYAASKRTLKRGGAVPEVPISSVEDSIMSDSVSESLIDVNEALARFEELDPRGAAVVELRFFTGLTYEEIAETLEISRATAVRDWESARLWLAREIRGSMPSSTDSGATTSA
jgi:RNA polymerase sigma-70 factor (ECF subfamily)